MSIELESVFARLLSKYENAFGEPPPFTAADADEVIAHMRRRLREAVRPGPAGWARGRDSGRQVMDGAAS